MATTPLTRSKSVTHAQREDNEVDLPETAQVTNGDLAVILKEIQRSLVDIKTDINVLKTDLTETRASLEFAHKEIEDLTETTQSHDKAIRELKVATQALQIAEQGALTQLNALEGYQRQWSVRISRLDDSSTGPPCLDQVANLISNIDGFPKENALASIENAHWLGVRDEGRPRQAIVRFFSRVRRNGILRASRQPGSKVVIYEDMTKSDYAAKKLAKPEMAKIWNTGRYVKFVNGKIVTGGKRN